MAGTSAAAGDARNGSTADCATRSDGLACSATEATEAAAAGSDHAAVQANSSKQQALQQKPLADSRQQHKQHGAMNKKIMLGDWKAFPRKKEDPHKQAAAAVKCFPSAELLHADREAKSLITYTVAQVGDNTCIRAAYDDIILQH